LENHLREETERRLKSGTPQDEAFRQACSDLGDPTRLSAEFAKLNGASIWRPARLASVAALSLTAFLFVLAIVAGASGRKTPLLSAHVMSVWAGYLISFMMGTLAIWYVVVRPFRNLSIGHAASLRKVVASLAGASALLTGAAILIGMIWAADHMGRYWAWDPKGDRRIRYLRLEPCAGCARLHEANSTSSHHVVRHFRKRHYIGGMVWIECGPGSFSTVFALTGFRCRATDLYRGRLSTAQKRLRHLGALARSTLECGDAALAWAEQMAAR